MTIHSLLPSVVRRLQVKLNEATIGNLSHRIKPYSSQNHNSGTSSPSTMIRHHTDFLPFLLEWITIHPSGGISFSGIRMRRYSSVTLWDSWLRCSYGICNFYFCGTCGRWVSAVDKEWYVGVGPDACATLQRRVRFCSRCEGPLGWWWTCQDAPFNGDTHLRKA
jgi:hypothetical protein